MSHVAQVFRPEGVGSSPAPASLIGLLRSFHNRKPPSTCVSVGRGFVVPRRGTNMSRQALIAHLATGTAVAPSLQPRISNRQTRRIESPLTYCKQTAGPHSNRQKWRSALFALRKALRSDKDRPPARPDAGRERPPVGARLLRPGSTGTEGSLFRSAFFVLRTALRSDQDRHPAGIRFGGHWLRELFAFSVLAPYNRESFS
jgi:hypothetical protein